MDKPFVDFAAVKERVRIEDVIPVLGLAMKGNDQLRGPCPACKGDPRALAIKVSQNSFYCHGRKKGGDVIALTAHVRGTGQRDAALFLQEHFGAEPKAPQAHHKRPRQAEALDTDHEVIELLGLTVEACEALGAGYCPTEERVLIPLRLPDGTSCGFLGIATREDQAPLLLFDIAERVKPEPEKVPADRLRKMLRVV